MTELRSWENVMRVVVCGRGAADHRSALWVHVMGSLRHLGHEVIGLDPTTPGRSGLVRGTAADALEAMLERFEPELFVHVPTPGDLDPRDVRRLTAATQTVSVALHASTTLGESVTCAGDAEEHLIDYDLVCVPDPVEAARLHEIAGYRVTCIEGAVHSPVLDEAVESDRRGVVVVGEPDDRGADVVRSIVESGVDVALFGSGWSLHADLEPLSFPRIGHPELATVLAGAELVVELPVPTSTLAQAKMSAWEAPVGQVVLEAAAVATPAITLERAGIAAAMTPGVDIATYATDGDISTLVSLLLSDEQGLREMGQRAADSVRAQHLWTQRWQTLLAPFECPDDDGELVIAKAETVVSLDERDRETASA